MGCRCSNRDIDFSRASNKSELIDLLILQIESIAKQIEEIRESKSEGELTKTCSKINFLVTIHNEGLDYISRIRKINIIPGDEKLNKLTFCLNEYFISGRCSIYTDFILAKSNLENLFKTIN